MVIRYVNRYVRKYIIFLSIIFPINFMAGHISCQDTRLMSKTFVIKHSLFLDSVFMSGTLDGHNTFSKLYSKEMWENKALRTFEPMRSIKISNQGDKKVSGPRLIINDHGDWYDQISISREAIRGAKTASDTILSIMYFIYENRASYMPANIDSYYGTKMLQIYGYGSCDQSSYLVRLISKSLDLQSKEFIMPHHVVSSVYMGNKWYHVDPDFRVFYLLKDNMTLASIEDILKDKYLITRTKHFGENVNYDKKLDEFVSSIIYDDLNNAMNKANPELFFDNFDYILKPSESIFFNWDNPAYYYQDWKEFQTIPESFIENIIGNGYFSLESDLKDIIPEEFFDKTDGMTYISSDDFSGLVLDSTDGSFELHFSSPFPVHDLCMDARIYLEDLTDSAEIFFSLADSNSVWEKVASISKKGFSNVSLNFKNMLKVAEERQEMPFAYKYKIMMNLFRSNGTHFCGIDSISIKSIFQISKFFMPTLSLGVNKIFYKDSSIDSLRNIIIELNWKETEENNPPLPPLSPIFPLDGALVDSLNFTFNWNSSSDPDGDSIHDYEFFLSDRIDLKFPLAPNFNQYVSCFDGGVNTTFSVKENGWLMDGKTYYWKVRAKDMRGAWGQWSKTWSFTPKGVMSPLNARIRVNNESVILSWDPNISGKKPDFYKIYGSNEMNGFSPNELNLIGVAYDPSFKFNYTGEVTPFSSYRISACTNDGQESGPSDIISIDGHSIFLRTDTVRSNTVFALNASVNEKYRSFYYYKNDTVFSKPQLEFLYYPYWLHQESDSRLSANIGTGMARSILFNDSAKFAIIKIIYPNNDTSIISINIPVDVINEIPLPFMSNDIGYVGETFRSLISTADGDIIFGDKNYFEVSELPSWLTFTILNDTLYLEGSPGEYDLGEDKIILSVKDSRGRRTEKTFYISVYAAPNDPLSLFPNPVLNYADIIIHLEKTSNIILSIVSFSGQVNKRLIETQFEPGIYQLPFLVNDLSSGTYVLDLIMNNIEESRIEHFSILFIKL